MEQPYLPMTSLPPSETERKMYPACRKQHCPQLVRNTPKITKLLGQRPKSSSLVKIRKNGEISEGITQMHGLQWFSSNLLFRTFKTICRKSRRRDVGSFQVNFLATNRTLNYLILTLQQMKSVSSNTQVEIILAENYRVTDFMLTRLTKSLRYLKELRSLFVDLAR